MTSAAAPPPRTEPEPQPRPPRRRVPASVPRAVALLVVVLAGVWLLKPHLGIEQLPAADGLSPDGCTITLAADANLGPDQAGTCLTGLTLTNDSLVPITLTAPLPAVLDGPGHVVTGLRPGTSVTGPAAASVRLERGEQVTVTVETVVPSCAAPGDTSGVTSVSGLRLDATIGPLNRSIEVPWTSTTRVVVDGGGSLPDCTG